MYIRYNLTNVPNYFDAKKNKTKINGIIFNFKTLNFNKNTICCMNNLIKTLIKVLINL